jgi:transcriptional regulator with XRE-family HTH domain
MTREPTAQQQRNRAEQERLYGAPLGDLVRELGTVFGLPQGRLAGVLGISAPMLSQLASGHRVKLGNPAAVLRLQRLLELAPAVSEGRTTAQDALEGLSRDGSEPFLTRSTRATSRRTAEAVQQLFSAVAPAERYRLAAARLESELPEVAELLRVYGAGPLGAAEEHLGSVLGAERR